MFETQPSSEPVLVQKTDQKFNLAQRKFYGARVSAYRILDMLFDDSPIQEMSRRHGLKAFFLEGHMDAKQYEWFEKLFVAESIKRIIQTGFNAGHSAFAFADLGADSVTSFDINEHAYVQSAHEYLVGRFPATDFKLVTGDSTKTLPAYQDETKYDIAFVDGGHSPEVAYSDLVSMQRLLKPGSYVVMDDYGDTKPWQIGPTSAFNQAASEGIIEPICIEHTQRSGWAVGRYTS